MGRKTARDGGAVAASLIADLRSTAAELKANGHADLLAIEAQLTQAADALEQVVSYVAGNMKSDIKAVFAGSVPYLKLAGIVLGGWQMARAALVSVARLTEGTGDQSFHQAKIATARFFAEHYLVQAGGLKTTIVSGSTGTLALTAEQF